MIFGQSASFQVEAIHTGTIDSRLYGNFCFHIAGRPIGDLRRTIELTSSARWARIFLDAGPRRVRTDLVDASADKVFDIIYRQYITGTLQVEDGHEYTVPDRQLESWDRDPYLLDDVGESSIRDKYTILVIRTSQCDDRIILKSHTEGMLNEFLIRDDGVDSALREYCIWIDTLYGAPVLPAT